MFRSNYAFYFCFRACLCLQMTARPAPAAAPALQPESAPAPAPPKPAPETEVPSKPAAEPAEAGQDSGKTPAPRKPRGTRATSMSLHSIMENETGAAASVSGTGAENADVVSDEGLLALWPELVRMYASRPRLSNTLTSAKLSAGQKDGVRVITFTVLNAAQKEWIETKMLHELEGNFARISGVSGIRLAVDIEPEEDRPQVNYMPSEKLNDLMSKNDEVRNLVSDFGLDLK